MIRRLRLPAILLALLIAAGLARVFDASPGLLSASGVVLLLLPGLALSVALMPTRPTDAPLRVALALGSSIATVILAALALDQLTRISPDGLALALGGVSLVAIVGVVALDRPDRMPSLSLGRMASWLLLIPALAVTVGAVAFSVHSARGERHVQFAQLSLRTTSPTSVRVALRGAGDERRYDVRVDDGNQTLAAWRGVGLGGGERWARTVALTIGTARVKAVVTRSGDPGRVYRSVYTEVEP